MTILSKTYLLPKPNTADHAVGCEGSYTGVAHMLKSGSAPVSLTQGSDPLPRGGVAPASMHKKQSESGAV